MSFKKMAAFTLLVALAGVISAIAVNLGIMAYGKAYITDPGEFKGAYTAIVPGAYVFPDGRLCDMLADRVNTAVDLYLEGKVEKILMTGDHGKTSYDEVNSMRRYAESRGVPPEDIFMDHAGFSTYDSMYRAREVFAVDSAVIVTQNFHLPRAVYIARKIGLQAVGISADRYIYAGAEIYEFREAAARLKAYMQVSTGASPQFLGPEIPVYGDGRLTHDQKY